MQEFASKVDENLREKNVYYDDLIGGNILTPLKLTPLEKMDLLII